MFNKVCCLWVLGLVFLLLGCTTVNTNPKNFPTASSPASKGYFVKLILPNEPKTLGAEATLTMKGHEPITRRLKADFVLRPESPPSIFFDVGAKVAPANLVIRYKSGEVKTLNKVVFNTTLTLK